MDQQQRVLRTVPYGDLDFSPPATRAQWKEQTPEDRAHDGSGLRRTCLTSPILASALLENYFVLFLILNIWVCVLKFCLVSGVWEAAVVPTAVGVLAA